MAKIKSALTLSGNRAHSIYCEALEGNVQACADLLHSLAPEELIAKEGNHDLRMT
jgi:hypothetical protein